ncbi:hypothetical protein CR513_36235, partial [Mucuna pruriens]
IPLKLIRAGVLVLGVDLEEGLDVACGGLVVLGFEGAVDAFEGVGAVDDGVDAEERGADAGLGEVELADLAANVVGEVGGGGDVGEHVVGVGVDDVEDVGGALERNMAANVTLPLAFTSSSLLKHKSQFGAAPKRIVSCSAGPFSFSSSSLCLVAGCSSKARAFTASAATADEETVVVGGEHVEEETWKQQRATEVYVCNLPRSCDTQQLLCMFNPHGTVLSAEVCRSAETGESRGSGYVTMASINLAKNAIAALDGSDVGGREMRVRFSAEMNPRRRNLGTMNSAPKRVIFYEGPHKLYVGNLSRAARPEDLRQLFGRFGNVASVRVLQDLRQGKHRVYAFVSYLSERERDAAKSLHGTEFCGRTLVIREGVERED